MPNETLAQMGFVDENEQEVVYDLEDTQSRTDISTINGKIPSAASSSNKLVDTTAMNDAIGQAVSAAYKPAGNKTVAELTSSLLVAANRGKVYNMTDAGTTTADFVEGAGHPIRVGDDIGICEPTTGTFKFNILSGFIAVDTNPTQGSANPVSSGGVYSELAGIKDGQGIDSFADVETALANKVDKVSGKGLSTNDYNNTAKGIVDNIQDNVKANTQLIKDTVGWSGKNKLTPRWNVPSGTVGQDVTIAYDSNRVVSLSGTASAKVSFDIKRRLPNNNDSDFYLPIGKYKYSISKASINGIGLLVATTYNNAYTVIPSTIDTDGGLVFEITQNTQSDYKLADGSVLVGVYIEVNKDINTDGIKLYPMVTDADIIDRRYEPYFGSTAFPRSEQAVLGAKNLLPPVKSGSIPNITFTTNADGSVDIVGSTTVSAVYNIVTALTNTPALILSGANGGSANTVYLEAVIRPLGGGSPIDVIDDVGNGASIRALASNEQMDIRIGYKADVTLNAKFYPMLRLASDPDDTYVPYAMTNKELTEKHTIKTWTNDNLAALITDTDATDMSASFVQKMGNLVVGRVQFKYAGTTTNTTKTIMTLPDELKPAINYTNKCYDMGNNSTTEGHDFYVDTAGQLQINLRGSHNASRWVCCNFTYISK